jgi:hypothetical protein
MAFTACYQHGTVPTERGGTAARANEGQWLYIPDGSNLQLWPGPQGLICLLNFRSGMYV